MVPRIVGLYLPGGRPETVVDLGCGTGLSTFLWAGIADRVIGVDSSADMLSVARLHAETRATSSSVTFREAFAESTGLEPASADVVTCSQSFHWMEPAATLREVARVLRPGGVFAAYDCDWPPALDWELERAFEDVRRRAGEIARASGRQYARQRDKGRHLDAIRASGLFRYAREIVFHAVEPCGARRFVGITLSQGWLQDHLKEGRSEAELGVAALRELAAERLGRRRLGMVLSYRLRLAVR